MEYKVFYSWQSDLPNATNRGFIEAALRKAADLVAKDDTVDVEPVVDRDTIGLAGSPEIASSIFSKIDAAQAFVADVSIINYGAASRLTPNPNVLLELGFAARSLSWDRIVMVFNTNYGRIEDLPFDLRTRRVLTYSAQEGEPDRSDAKKILASGFEAALRAVIEHRPPDPIGQSIVMPMPAETAILAMEEAKPNQSIMVQRFWQWLMEQISAVAPDYSAGTVERDEMLVRAIPEAEPLFVAFAKVAETAAATNSDAIAQLTAGFEALLNRYDLPRRFSGQFYDTDFDFYKFVGHELYVDFISALLTHKRWDRLKDVFEHDYYPERRMDLGLPNGPAISYSALSRTATLLDYRKQRLQLPRLSLHADLTSQLHSEGELAQNVTLDRFTEAEVFIFMRSLADNNAGRSSVWLLRSTYYLSSPPRFILNAQRGNYAQSLCVGLGVSSIEELRATVTEGMKYIYKTFREGWLQGPGVGIDMLNAIGTK